MQTRKRTKEIARLSITSFLGTCFLLVLTIGFGVPLASAENKVLSLDGDGDYNEQTY